MLSAKVKALLTPIQIGSERYPALFQDALVWARRLPEEGRATFLSWLSRFLYALPNDSLMEVITSILDTMHDMHRDQRANLVVALAQGLQFHANRARYFDVDQPQAELDSHGRMALTVQTLLTACCGLLPSDQRGPVASVLALMGCYPDEVRLEVFDDALEVCVGLPAKDRGDALRGLGDLIPAGRKRPPELPAFRAFLQACRSVSPEERARPLMKLVPSVTLCRPDAMCLIGLAKACALAEPVREAKVILLELADRLRKLPPESHQDGFFAILRACEGWPSSSRGDVVLALAQSAPAESRVIEPLLCTMGDDLSVQQRTRILYRLSERARCADTNNRVEVFNAVLKAVQALPQDDRNAPLHTLVQVLQPPLPAHEKREMAFALLRTIKDLESRFWRAQCLENLLKVAQAFPERLEDLEAKAQEALAATD